jgi:hypothetical protein
LAAIDWNNDVKNATITDVQNQPFSGQSQLPVGAVATTNELVVVLSNGKTLKICGVKLQDGTPRTIARLEKNTPTVDVTTSP